MKKLNNNSGFTLIEIIVVLIIVGILAAVALPNLFSNVSTSKGASALQSASALEATLDACVQKSNGLPGVDGASGSCSLSSLFNAAASDSLTVSNGFDVEITAAAGSAGANTLTYTLKGADSTGDVAFTLVRGVTGVFVCSPGLSPYKQVC